MLVHLTQKEHTHCLLLIRRIREPAQAFYKAIVMLDHSRNNKNKVRWSTPEHVDMRINW